jgi:plasmid maintenance system killer protein
MADHDFKGLTKRQRKKLQMKKNLHHQKIYDAARKRLGEQKKLRDVLAKQEDLKKKKRNREEEKGHDKKEIWSVQVSSIRNRLTGHKRLSEERWNRFAGTDDGGGRGR